MKQPSLFDEEVPQPLASRLRPRSLDEFVGQTHLLSPGKVLRRLIESDQISSMVFWGPPGVGKTTLARIIAHCTKSSFIDFSAVISGIKEIRTVMQKAEENRRFGEKTIVFVDEIHRFNKAQQDAFLPFVEKGSIILIGATTENPSFEINGALLSRCKVFVLQGLKTEELTGLLVRALTDPRGFGNQKINIEKEMLEHIANFANGDARSALSTLEMVVLNGDLDEKGTVTVTPETLEQCVSKRSLLYDKNGEEHYNLISALHKSMRNSDPDAAVYWLARMLEAGEDPLYVARRIVRFASEDIGLADPRALEISVAAFQACHFLGMPECAVHLTQAVIYMAMVPKSNAMYTAYESAKKDALTQLADPVPLVIRNAPTRLMKDLDYGKGYQYAHNTEEKLTAMQCLPDSLLGKEYYNPTDQGTEARFKTRLEQIKNWKFQNRTPNPPVDPSAYVPNKINESNKPVDHSAYTPNKFTESNQRFDSSNDVHKNESDQTGNTRIESDRNNDRRPAPVSDPAREDRTVQENNSKVSDQVDLAAKRPESKGSISKELDHRETARNKKDLSPTNENPDDLKKKKTGRRTERSSGKQ